ncbi:MAG: hypothetical protein U1D67_00345, partial [Dehalococcoidia bacterium]|nr:hypothetical protein [Dehalococcoidia bacterium]
MEAIRLLKKRPWGIPGAVILLAVILLAALSPVIAPYFFNQMNMTQLLEPPGGDFILGTDNLGRDIFSRFVYGSRPYLGTGLIAVGIASLLGILPGITFARAGRKAQNILKVALIALSIIGGLTVLLAATMVVLRFIPFLSIGRLMTSIHGFGNTGLFMVITGLLLSFIFLPSVYFSMRSASIDGLKQGFISLLSAIPVHLGVATGLAVVVIAPMSYYGFGIPPPLPEWGNMLSGAGPRYMLTAPWTVVAPNIAIAITLLGLVLFGLATREIWFPT